MTWRSAFWIAGALLAGSAAGMELAAQKPVVTLTTSATEIAERITLTRSTTGTIGTISTATTTSSRTTALPSTNSATLTVNRTGPTSLTDLTVRYSVRGTANPGRDYTALSGTVTIPRSASSITIKLTAVDDLEIEQDETIVIDLVATATSPYVLTDPASVTIRIIDDDVLQMSDLDIVTDTILAGASVDVRITLTAEAPVGGTTVAITTSDGSVSAPAITIAQGTRTGVGTLSTSAVSSPTAVIVQGALGGVIRRDTLMLYPAPRVQSIQLGHDALFAGTSTSGTIQLDRPAPPMGSTVDLRARVVLVLASRTTPSSTTTTLSSTTTTLAAVPITIPASVTIAPGASSAMVTMPTSGVTGATNVEVSALIGGSSVRDTLLVHPLPVIALAELRPNQLEGGAPVNATIRLESPIPAGMTWSVGLSTTGSLVLPLVRTASFPAGSSEWTQTLDTRAVAVVETACLQINRRNGGCVTLLPPSVTGFAVTREAEFGGRNISGSITVSRALPSQSQSVTLGVQVLNPAGAASPLAGSQVDVPAGQTTANWSLGTSAVTQPVTVELSTPAGLADTVTIHPLPVVASSDLQPNAVEGGEPVTATIRLEAPIPPGLMFVMALSSSGSLTLQQASATFSAGATEWTRILPTRAVAVVETACLRITSPIQRSAGCVTLSPPSVTGFSIWRDVEFGGRNISGSITTSHAVAGRAMFVDLRVQVLSPAGAASPLTGPRVEIPAGETTSNWSLGTSDVTQPVTIEVSTPAGLADTVTIHPFPVVASADLAPNAVEGGESVTSTIRLEAPIPPGLNLVLNLSSTGSLVVRTGAVNFSAGSTESTQTLPTRAVASLETACLRITSPIQRSAGCVTLRPPSVTGFNITRDAEFGGRNISGSITTSQAVAGRTMFVDLRVQVLSPAGAASPLTGPRVEIPAGETTSSWSLGTSVVTQPVTIEVSTPAGQADTVTIHPFPVIVSADLAPNAVEGGESVTSTIRLESPIPPGLSLAMTLGSSGSLIVQQATAYFPAGATVSTRTLSTRAVATLETACLRITGPIQRSGGCVTLRPPSVTGIDIPEDGIFGGNSVSGTVIMSRAVSGSSQDVNLVVQVLSPAGAASPLTVSRVQVPAGQSIGPWSFPSSAVTQAVTIAVTAGGLADTMTVHPRPVLQSVELSPDPATGGNRVEAKVRLERQLPSGLDWTIMLIGSGGLLPNGNLTIRIRQRTVEWTDSIATSQVTQPTTAQLVVQSGNSAMPASVTLLPPPPPVPASLSLQPSTVVGGATVAATVVLDRDAPAGGTQISVRSENTNLAQAPTSVTVAAGSRQVAFDVATSPVQSTESLRLTATANGRTVQVALRLDPPPPSLVGLRILPSTAPGGQRTNATVTISRAVRGGQVVDLTSARPTIASVPATVRVPDGATSVSFDIQTTAVAQTVGFPIEARIGADVVRDNLIVEAPPPVPVPAPAPVIPGLASLQIVPASGVIGGASFDVTLTLDGNAPAGGLLVNLRSSNPLVAAPPPSVTIAAGSRSATVPVRTTAVAAPTTITLTAERTGDRLQEAVNVTTQPIDRIQIPNSVRASTQTDASVRLSQPAPAGGLIVPLSSSDPIAAAVPPTVTIPAGSTQGTFVVRTSAVQQDTEITITAGAGQATTTFRVRAR